jgi:hypothetical protein
MDKIALEAAVAGAWALKDVSFKEARALRLDIHRRCSKQVD